MLFICCQYELHRFIFNTLVDPHINKVEMLCVVQGVVCTLHEGDDFGKLALVNDAPRAASIVLREDNCHFLRVDKEDFNRILRVRGHYLQCVHQFTFITVLL